MRSRRTVLRRAHMVSSCASTATPATTGRRERCDRHHLQGRGKVECGLHTFWQKADVAAVRGTGGRRDGRCFSGPLTAPHQRWECPCGFSMSPPQELRVVEHDSPQTFLARAGGWLARAEAEHGAFFTICGRLTNATPS